MTRRCAFGTGDGGNDVGTYTQLNPAGRAKVCCSTPAGLRYAGFLPEPTRLINLRSKDYLIVWRLGMR